ncbi:ser/Thr protein phosphatase family [Xylaria nigripes]|nr:ser/Thr protein phosphatase family [Xylaria nigripes]
MIYKAAVVAAALVVVANGGQPGAPTPVAAPMRELDWGQINFLHTTDTHGWLAGHLQEPQYSADWGDYVSFTEHMRKKADEKGVDLLVVDTGDRVEGNGLYDASEPKGKFIYEIFGQQTLDLMCTGNHELYSPETFSREHNITVSNFPDAYIASNIDYIDPKTGKQIPQAQRYVKFKTKNLGLTVVAFGFLFDFDRNSNNSVVIPVQETLKARWFQDAIREKPDLFVVLGHVGLRMKEFEQIFKVIRDENWYTPIAFLGGHAHVRDTRKFDEKAFAIASGRYFETIGWMSIDGIEKRADESSPRASVTFKRRYIDNNILGLQHHAGVDQKEFATEFGLNISQMIATSRATLDLDHRIGCSPKDLWLTRAKYPGDSSSIFSWLENEVIRDTVMNQNRSDISRLTIINTGAVRFDIFKGAFTKDSTYLISPFTSKFNYIPDVPYKVAKKVLQLLNEGGPVFEGARNPDHLSIPEPKVTEQLFDEEVESDAQSPLGYFGQERPHHSLFYSKGDGKDEPELVNGYTTKDDLGDDGDDAIHSPIQFYNVPNCFQSEVAFTNSTTPEKVDLVFIDYVQPWIIPALKFSGGDYSTDDVKVYSNDTLTDVIAGWVKKNWKGDC